MAMKAFITVTLYLKVKAFLSEVWFLDTIRDQITLIIIYIFKKAALTITTSIHYLS